jgi:uncharacterized tellurite resistance protein B-like protein
MSEVKYTLSHALCMVYLEMTAADGKFEDSEMEEAAKKVFSWREVFEYDPKQTWKESLGWFKSFDAPKSRVEAVFNILELLKEKMPKEALVAIANDLADIGQADGEVAENECQMVELVSQLRGIQNEDLK